MWDIYKIGYCGEFENVVNMWNYEYIYIVLCGIMGIPNCGILGKSEYLHIYM